MSRWSDFLHCSKQSTEGGSSVYYAVEEAGEVGGGEGWGTDCSLQLASVPGSAGSRQADSCSQQVDALCFGLPSVSCLSMCTWESLV